ncbi:MAG: hypothetical protein KDI90_10290 [Alphaproteobacteria bacterium]|nr:hypothetical protein [Alphaproteobacteria bacterium]MCB1682065.1 hypothetical protein [Alphaproteobacteria bacterium]MCB9975725.1 hypothetical protein [Rhodospirillales bacterium]
MGEELETIMKARRIPEPSPDFASRIIAEATRLPQERAVRRSKPGRAPDGLFSGLRDWWNDFRESVALPQPALVMTLVLLAGFAAGASGLDDSLGAAEEDDAPFGVVVLDVMDMEGLS